MVFTSFFALGNMPELSLYQLPALLLALLNVKQFYFGELPLCIVIQESFLFYTDLWALTPWVLFITLCHSGMNGARQDLTGPGKGPVLPSYVKCTLSVPSLTLQHLSNLPLLHYVLACMSSSAACIPIAYVLMSVQWSVVSMSTYFFLYMSMGF